jgi:hypothetical protein
MVEKKKWCRSCHGGVLHPTPNANELKCNYCGWSKTEIDLKDYVTSKGMWARRTKWFLWRVLVLVMKWLIQWDMLRTIQALNIVRNARSLCLVFPISVRAAVLG